MFPEPSGAVVGIVSVIVGVAVSETVSVTVGGLLALPPIPSVLGGVPAVSVWSQFAPPQMYGFWGQILWRRAFVSGLELSPLLGLVESSGLVPPWQKDDQNPQSGQAPVGSVRTVGRFLM